MAKAINRTPNRLEKRIQLEIKKECRRRKVWFWGEDHWIQPAYVNTGRGDGMQLVWLQPLDARPTYYVLRVDSKEDVRSENYEWDELLLQPIESEYGNIDSYREVKVNGRTMYKELYEPELYPESKLYFPMLSWSGGAWGVIKNFNKPQTRGEGE